MTGEAAIAKQMTAKEESPAGPAMIGFAIVRGHGSRRRAGATSLYSSITRKLGFRASWVSSLRRSAKKCMSPAMTTGTA